MASAAAVDEVPVSEEFEDAAHQGLDLLALGPRPLVGLTAPIALSTHLTPSFALVISEELARERSEVEILVCVVQTLVFTLLTMVYIELATGDAH